MGSEHGYDPDSMGWGHSRDILVKYREKID